MATFVALTHVVNHKPTPAHVSIDQICRVADSAGAEPGYPTTILMTNAQTDVRETVAEVMQLINAATAQRVS
jgi:hypothetical protein